MEICCFRLLLCFVVVKSTCCKLQFDIFGLFSAAVGGGGCQDINNINCSEARNAEQFTKNHQKVNSKFNVNFKLCMKNIKNPEECMS